MARNITLAEFYERGNAIRCNNILEAFDNISEAFECGYAFGEDDESCAFNYWLTNFNDGDVAYYNKNYGLKFFYCVPLGIWVFINDIACGISPEDVELEVK